MSDVGKTKPRLREREATFSIVASPWYRSGVARSPPWPLNLAITASETSTVNAPRPETRCTFSVSERWPQMS